MGIEEKYYKLLKIWCDSLISLQIKEFPQEYFKGGILCPSCKIIHGRIADAIYPMIFMYDKTREQQYLDSAEQLFDWSKNLLTDDGSYYNDAQNDWNGITVFFVSMLTRTLLHHGGCIPKSLKERFEERLEQNVEWVYRMINDSFDTNVNYHAAAAEALGLYGIYSGRTKYLNYMEERVRFTMKYFSDSGFLTGESHPRDYLSPRGLPGIDMGYNLEESLPSLFECAEILNNKTMKQQLLDSLRVHCRFLLPDGGMDNSFGSRNYKWTYWGSRTSDGYLAMMEQAGREEEDFLKYKYAAFEIFLQCTHNGLLYGGPDYFEHGELPCVHHTFCKAKAVAALLDGGIKETKKMVSLIEKTKIFSYPELLTEQYFCGGFYASATANDVFYQKGGHISGGTLGVLWHKKTGPLLVASVMENSLYEVTNSQLSLKKENLGKMSLRFEKRQHGKVFSSDQDYCGNIRSSSNQEKIYVETWGTLKTLDNNSGEEYRFCYQIAKDLFSAQCICNGDGNLFVPVIGKKIEKIGKETLLLITRTGWPVHITYKGELIGIKKRFQLSGGFIAWEIEICLDKGKSSITLEVQKERGEIY